MLDPAGSKVIQLDWKFTTPLKVQRILEAFEIGPERAETVALWVEIVGQWNQRLDLTAARDADELADLMVADAAFLSKHVGEGARVVDVGTGAGAPGLPLVLLRPDVDMTLVEPLQKRAALLRLIKGQHPSARIAVHQGKGEAVDGHFDVAISRATLPPPAWLQLGASLGDTVWVLLARHEPPALDGWAIAQDTRYAWPLTDAKRRAVAYRKLAKSMGS